MPQAVVVFLDMINYVAVVHRQKLKLTEFIVTAVDVVSPGQAVVKQTRGIKVKTNADELQTQIPDEFEAEFKGQVSTQTKGWAWDYKYPGLHVQDPLVFIVEFLLQLQAGAAVALVYMEAVASHSQIPSEFAVKYYKQLMAHTIGVKLYVTYPTLQTQTYKYPYPVS